MFFLFLFISIVILKTVDGETGSAALLTKPHTLKIVASMPITGKIFPMGNMCFGPMQIALDNVNNRSDILPQYNLVVDVVDDQCLLIIF